MQVVVDIGNSSIVIGINGGGIWQHIWRIPTIQKEEASVFYNVELASKILESNVHIDAVKGVILSTVVPALKQIFIDVLEAHFQHEVRVVEPSLYELLDYEVPRPYEMGTDIVANAYCAYKKHGSACIIVDFGTALTFTTIGEKGIIKGVAIAPGIKTAMKALNSNTAQLPEIPLDLPDSVLGMNTTHAIQAGILWGYVGMVREMLSKIRSEVQAPYNAIATGGLSFVMAEVQEMFELIDRDLTINGLLLMSQDAQLIEKNNL